MSSMGSRATSRKDDPLKKKIPINPKYRNVEAVVDSGSSMNKYLKKIEEIRTNYRYKPNELFKRMKVSTFVQLIIQVSSVDGDIFFDEQSEAGDSARPSTMESELSRLDTARSDVTLTSEINGGAGDSHETGRDTTRSTLHGLITGVGEFDLNEKENKDNSKPKTLHPSQPDPYLMEKPFLLLDARDQDEYEQCHIISAENFPVALLSRSCNYESKSMLQYKNQPGKIIVLYDEDERVAPKAATTLVERGYDNLFLLSGGLKVAHKLYPIGLITGTVPASIATTKQSVIVKADQAVFTRDNIFSLLDQTEVSYADKGKQPGSRATTRSTQSRATSNGTAMSSASSVIHRKPFR